MKMDQKKWRVIGVVVLILGIITLLFSVQAAHKIVEQVYEEVMGRETTSARWHITIGILMVIGGLLAIILPFYKSKSKRK